VYINSSESTKILKLELKNIYNTFRVSIEDKFKSKFIEKHCLFQVLPMVGREGSISEIH
jgi:hypothetical protein